MIPALAKLFKRKIKHTEEFIKSDYTAVRKQLSLIDPSVMHTVNVGIICPKCKKDHEYIEHGESFQCDCRLEVIALGNSLFCSIYI